MEASEWRHDVELVAGAQLLCDEFGESAARLNANADFEWPLAGHRANAVSAAGQLAIDHGLNGQMLARQEREIRLQILGHCQRKPHGVRRFVFQPRYSELVKLPHVPALRRYAAIIKCT
jgi:hypothetical protein